MYSYAPAFSAEVQTTLFMQLLLEPGKYGCRLPPAAVLSRRLCWVEIRRRTCHIVIHVSAEDLYPTTSVSFTVFSVPSLIATRNLDEPNDPTIAIVVM